MDDVSLRRRRRDQRDGHPHPLRIDRREVGAPGEFDRVSDDELQDWIAGETAKLVDLPDDGPDEAGDVSAAG